MFVNKSFLKFITDFGPLLIFFTIYYKSGNNLSAAIPPLIISTLIAVVIMYFVEKKIPYVPLIGAVVISLFGGLTLYFNNPIFIYMKPTIVNLIFAAILLVSKSFFNKNFLKLFLQTAFQLNEEGWGKLNSRWAYFFIFLALLNDCKVNGVCICFSKIICKGAKINFFIVRFGLIILNNWDETSLSNLKKLLFILK